MEAESETTNLLVVEDERDVAVTYARALSSEFDVEIAGTGQKGLEILAADGIDIIVLDRRLPGMSGDEFLKTARKRGYSCPVVMMTAVEPDFDVLWLDFDDYLVKPVAPSVLQETLERNLELTSYAEPIQEYLKLVETQRLIAENNSEDQLTEHEEYQSLLRRRDELRKDVEAIIEEIDEEELIKLGIRDLWLND